VPKTLKIPSAGEMGVGADRKYLPTNDCPVLRARFQWLKKVKMGSALAVRGQCEDEGRGKAKTPADAGSISTWRGRLNRGVQVVAD